MAIILNTEITLNPNNQIAELADDTGLVGSTQYVIQGQYLQPNTRFVYQDLLQITLSVPPVGVPGANTVVPCDVTTVPLPAPVPPPARYPYLQKDQLLAGNLNFDLNNNPASTPPQSAHGTAELGKLWFDTSAYPWPLRVCAVSTASPTYNPAEWFTLARVSPGSDFSNLYMPLSGDSTKSGSLTVTGYLTVNSSPFNLNGVSLQANSTAFVIAPVAGGNLSYINFNANQATFLGSLNVQSNCDVTGTLQAGTGYFANGAVITSNNGINYFGSNAIAFEWAPLKVYVDHTFVGLAALMDINSNLTVATLTTSGNLTTSGSITCNGNIATNGVQCNTINLVTGNINNVGWIFCNGISVNTNIDVGNGGNINNANLIYGNIVYCNQVNVGNCLYGDIGMNYNGNWVAFGWSGNGCIQGYVNGTNVGDIPVTNSNVNLGACGFSWIQLNNNRGDGISVYAPAGSGYFAGVVFAGAFNSISDVRAKANTGPVTVDTLAQLNLVNLISYDMTVMGETKHYDAGFDAQQLQGVVPSAVEDHADTGMLGVDLLPMVAYLVGGIQELTARVQALEAARS